jgi:signal transduction histidine kinase/CheY-like chemotaxis protein
MKRLGLFLRINDRTLPIEDRVFIIACSAAVFASILSFVANIFLGLDWRINVITLLIGIVYSIFLNVLLKGKASERLRLSFVVIGLSIFVPVWFYNGGTDGAIPVYFIFIMAVGMLALGVGYHRIFGVGLTTLMVLLYILEKKYPEFVTHYPNSSVREQDILITILIAVIIVGLVLSFFKKSYDTERDELSKSQQQLHEYTQGLITAKLEAEAATAAKSKFLANMSHEIRTPLNGIIGSTQLLTQANNIKPEQKELFQTLEASCNLLLNIIEDVLDISKIEAEKLVLVEKSFNLREAVKSVIDITSPRINEMSKHLFLKYDIEDDVVNFVVGDENRIKQVLVNLVGNAIKFTEIGGIEVVVSAKEIRNHVQLITFTVRDTGIGIKKDDLPRLFQPFTQVDFSSSRKYSGTGLGLSICKKLVEMMSGYIDVKSNEGRGSEFSFTIPMKVSDGVAFASTETQSFDLVPLNILLVEDNQINQLVASRIFETIGYTVDMADNGAEAIEKAKAVSYDLIFMDIQMPEVDGIEATKAILSNYTDQESAPTIIAMTANAMKEDEEECRSAGMKDFISKPFTIDALKTMIARWSAKAHAEKIS